MSVRRFAVSSAISLRHSATSSSFVAVPMATSYAVEMVLPIFDVTVPAWLLAKDVFAVRRRANAHRDSLAGGELDRNRNDARAEHACEHFLALVYKA